MSEQSEEMKPKELTPVEVLTRSWAMDQADFMSIGKQSCGELNLPQLGRYLKHLTEEADEVDKASKEGDAVALVDGLGDAIVIALGAMHSLGVDPEYIWEAIFRANMRKFPEGKPYYRPDGQIGKPPGWYGPEGEILTHLRERGIPEVLPPLL